MQKFLNISFQKKNFLSQFNYQNVNLTLDKLKQHDFKKIARFMIFQDPRISQVLSNLTYLNFQTHFLKTVLNLLYCKFTLQKANISNFCPNFKVLAFHSTHTIIYSNILFFCKFERKDPDYVIRLKLSYCLNI